MWLTNRWLCVFDIKNRQSEYSHIAELIRDLEQLGDGMPLNYQNVADISGLRITRAPSISGETGQKFEEEIKQVVELETRLAEGNSAQFSTITSWEMLTSGLNREPGVRGFSYYIRVNIDGDGSDLPDLRYLALLIQSILKACGRLAVFFWSNEISQKENFAHYNRLSQFLRPFQIKYEVFYTVCGNNIKKLTTKPDIPQSFLPLLEIDSDTCSILRQPWNLSVLYRNQAFDKLFASIYPDGAQDREVTILFQIGARMFFRALSGRKYTTSAKKHRLLESLSSVVEAAGGISALDMLLFGTLMDRELYDNLGMAELSEYLECVQSLSKAIAQILENIVYHSENKKGVFTIRIQTGWGYIQKNYPNYQIGEQEYGLELLIADSNHQNGIVQNFLTGGKATPSLKSSENEITLADFFQKEPESSAAQAWTGARTRGSRALSWSTDIC